MSEQKEFLKNKKYGDTQRLGNYACEILLNTIARRAYDKTQITERHRHRYEFNNAYRKKLEQRGLKVSGINPERGLVEIIEIPDHPFFVGTQFHPEFTSRPLRPHPLFLEFIQASAKRIK